MKLDNGADNRVYNEKKWNRKCNDIESPNFKILIAQKCPDCLKSYYMDVDAPILTTREKEKERIHEELKTHTHLATDNRRGLEITAYMYILDLLVDIKDELVELNKKVVIKN